MLVKFIEINRFSDVSAATVCQRFLLWWQYCVTVYHILVLHLLEGFFLVIMERKGQ
jgi:hypothetical protein